MVSNFKYSILIPEYKVQDSGRYRWCVEHVGYVGTTWKYDFVDATCANTIIKDVPCYYFINEDDALMFKLKFG